MLETKSLNILEALRGMLPLPSRATARRKNFWLRSNLAGLGHLATMSGAPPLAVGIAAVPRTVRKCHTHGDLCDGGMLREDDGYPGRLPANSRLGTRPWKPAQAVAAGSQPRSSSDLFEPTGSVAYGAFCSQDVGARHGAARASSGTFPSGARICDRAGGQRGGIQ